jgi:hypothetical protein
MFWKCVELYQGLMQQLWGTRAEQMVDLVVREAPTEQTKLHLGIVHIPEQLVNIIQGFEFFLHELGGEEAGSNGGT